MDEKQKEEFEFLFDPKQPMSIEQLKKRIKSLDADLLGIEASKGE